MEEEVGWGCSAGGVGFSSGRSCPPPPPTPPQSPTPGGSESSSPFELHQISDFSGKVSPAVSCKSKGSEAILVGRAFLFPTLRGLRGPEILREGLVCVVPSPGLRSLFSLVSSACAVHGPASQTLYTQTTS